MNSKAVSGQVVARARHAAAQSFWCPTAEAACRRPSASGKLARRPVLVRAQQVVVAVPLRDLQGSGQVADPQRAKPGVAHRDGRRDRRLPPRK
ncbi:MAG TPA: hypothetical protein VHZ03_42755 [Trebonia sp.]|nr:hypothetical protein [Trebonia sp.]